MNVKRPLPDIEWQGSTRTVQIVPPLKIGLLLYENCMPAGLFAFADLLLGANSRAGKQLFETVWVAREEAPVRCAHGMVLRPREFLGTESIDALLVPGFWADSYERLEHTAAGLQPLVDSLSRLDPRVALWSYCTGVFLLARAGALDGRAATSTWWLAGRLEQRFPAVDWQFQHTYVVDSHHRERIVTASGVNGHLAIAQGVIEKRLSKAAYADIRRLMVLPRPEPALPIFESLHLIRQPSRILRKLHLAVEKMAFSLATNERLAEALAMSPRTLARKVGEATGHTVAQHVRLIKLNQASEKLLRTSRSVTQIGEELGFSDESSFRRVFRKTTGYTPKVYRQKFNGVP
jgi:transcriptional regulator GlxA family with amidase domain